MFRPRVSESDAFNLAWYPKRSCFPCCCLSSQLRWWLCWCWLLPSTPIRVAKIFQPSMTHYPSCRPPLRLPPLHGPILAPIVSLLLGSRHPAMFQAVSKGGGVTPTQSTPSSDLAMKSLPVSLPSSTGSFLMNLLGAQVSPYPSYKKSFRIFAIDFIRDTSAYTVSATTMGSTTTSLLQPGITPWVCTLLSG